MPVNGFLARFSEVILAYPAAGLDLYTEQFIVLVGYNQVDFSLVLVPVVTNCVSPLRILGYCAYLMVNPTLNQFSRTIAVEECLFLVP